MAKYKETSVAALFQNQVAKLGSKGCVAYKKGGRYTDISWNEMDVMIRKLGWYLMSIGIKKGDKVAIMLPNIPEFVYSCFAVFQSGAVAVLLNTGSTPYELTYLLNNSDAKILVTHAAGEKRYLEIKDQLATCRNLLTIDPTQNAFLSENASDIAAPPSVPIDADDPAVMIYTAGLTGKPLGAVLTHGKAYQQQHR